MKFTLLTGILILAFHSAILANGGASQSGVPATGHGSTKGQITNVAIENETLKIDLHVEFAAVEVHYRMHNTGLKVEQDFFFPVELWGEQEESADGPTQKPRDLERYQITVDGKALKWTDVPGKKEDTSESVSGELWQEKVTTIKSWKKSVIPFERNQTHEVTIRYGARYAANDESVSDDEHMGDATFAYSLSPAATWKGPIGKGKIDINILHPEPEDVSIEKPKDRFKKTSDAHYEWTFENLKPSLADDIRIVAHPKYDRYMARSSSVESGAQGFYVIRGNKYFIDHADYVPVASSTLKPDKEHKYDVANIKSHYGQEGTWAEGVEGDGVGENITLDVKCALPLYGILIRPGNYSIEHKDLWSKNNRVAALEITLNEEHTINESIPDEPLDEPYLIRVRNYTKPVNKVKLVIKAVHRGTKYRDTCISLVELRAPLSQKPEIQPAR
jgi:hypothetical protein